MRLAHHHADQTLHIIGQLDMIWGPGALCNSVYTRIKHQALLASVVIVFEQQIFAATDDTALCIFVYEDPHLGRHDLVGKLRKSPVRGCCFHGKRSIDF